MKFFLRLQHQTPDERLRMRLVLICLATPAVIWLVVAMALYSFPRGMFWAVAKGAFLATFNVWPLWALPLSASVIAVGLSWVAYRYFQTRFEGPYFLKRFEGPPMVSMLRARFRNREDVPQLRFCGVPVPRNIENLHFLTAGSTGSGKSVAMADYLASIQERASQTGVPERMMCVDPDGGYMKRFYQAGDTILNPFDERGQGWSIFNELRTGFDCDQYAASLIPKSPSTEQEEWASMARVVTAATLKVLKRDYAGTTEELVNALCVMSNAQMKTLLAGTEAAGVFHGAEETLGSIRTVLTRYIAPHKHLSVGQFSIRHWLERGRGNLWVTWKEDTLQSLKPLISCWVDTICVATLSLVDDENRRLHLICDELDSLEKLNYLIDAATKGRKKGLRIHPGLQSFAQLDETYGAKDALTLRNSLRNVALFGVTGADTYTTEQFSKTLGKHIVSRLHVSDGKSSNKNLTRDEEFVVPASAFSQLPANSGYMKLANNHPIVRFAMKPRNMAIRVPGLMPNASYQSIIQSRAPMLFDPAE
jgi:hypothetical protein